MLQQQIELIPIKEGEVNGISMGVLPDGTPYLSARGLASLCGVAPSSITTLTSNWDLERVKPRGIKISALLREQGILSDDLFIQVTVQGQKVSAFNDISCMAVLEYYAFDSSSTSDIALQNYRLLARRSLREFVYTSLGYDPLNSIPEAWKHFHDRMILNEIPRGYFSVFKEVADIVVSGIRHGLKMDSHVVPDISVGRLWSSHWEKYNFDNKYGARTKHPHTYPDYFPQAKAGPRPAYIYPLSALGEFRIWLEQVYLVERFPNYLADKSKSGFIPAGNINLYIEAVTPKSLTQK
ncbi:hypothetical protein [Aeromonas jandaei]|uniref:hypothetical protein n=1 Tax=Aeromonas TaxID=642 RepID=UPI003BA274B7